MVFLNHELNSQQADLYYFQQSLLFQQLLLTFHLQHLFHARYFQTHHLMKLELFIRKVTVRKMMNPIRNFIKVF